MLLADGFEGAFIGVATRCGQPTLAVYSAHKCIKLLVERDGMTHEEALEYFNFNVVGGWVGEEPKALVLRLEELAPALLHVHLPLLGKLAQPALVQLEVLAGFRPRVRVVALARETVHLVAVLL